MKTDKAIGFVGLGIMGSGMALNLLKDDVKLAVFNRTSEKTQDLVTRGATLCHSLQEVGELTEILFLCVTDEAAAESVLLGENGVCSAQVPPRIIVDCSTISPDAAVRFSSLLSERGISYLDAPVSGGDVGAKNGTLTVMVGGDEKAFLEVDTLLTAIGSKIFYLGQSGAGQRTKAVNQLVVSLNVLAMSEGLALSSALGLDQELTLSVISKGAAGSWSLDNYGPRVLHGDLKPGFRARDMLKDLKIAAKTLEGAERRFPGLSLAIKRYEDLTASTEEELGNHALITLY